MKPYPLKKLASALLLGSAVLLAGCQAQHNTLTFTPPAPNAQFNTLHQRIVVNVITQDQRNSKTISSYTSAGNIRHLTAQPEIAQLFQQVVQQGLNSKGFRLASGAASNSNLIVKITDFNAQVAAGNLKHKINSKVNIVLEVQGTKGSFSKSFGATHSQEGIFGASNEDIQKLLDKSFKSVTAKFYNDSEISNALLKLN